MAADFLMFWLGFSLLKHDFGLQKIFFVPILIKMTPIEFCIFDIFIKSFFEILLKFGQISDISSDEISSRIFLIFHLGIWMVFSILVNFYFWRHQSDKTIINISNQSRHVLWSMDKYRQSMDAPYEYRRGRSLSQE